MKSISLPDLAEKAGVSKGFLSQLENDDTANPSLETLNKIAKALNITLGELLGEDVVQSKKAVPEVAEPELQEFIRDREQAGKPVAPDVLRSLYALKERRGVKKKSKEDWTFLCRAIEEVHLKK